MKEVRKGDAVDAVIDIHGGWPIKQEGKRYVRI